MNFLFGIVEWALYKTRDDQDPLCSKPLMNYLFGNQEQAFLSWIYVHLFIIYHSEDYETECQDIMKFLVK